VANPSLVDRRHQKRIYIYSFLNRDKPPPSQLAISHVTPVPPIQPFKSSHTHTYPTPAHLYIALPASWTLLYCLTTVRYTELGVSQRLTSTMYARFDTAMTNTYRASLYKALLELCSGGMLSSLHGRAVVGNTKRGTTNLSCWYIADVCAQQSLLHGSTAVPLS